MEDGMNYSVRSAALFLFVILFVAGCVSTSITAPDIRDKAAGQKVLLKIEYKNLPGEESIAMLSPNGKKSGVTNNPGRLDKIMVPAIEKVVKNKGYSVTDNAGTAKAVLTIDYNEFGIYWASRPSSSYGEYRADARHYLTLRNSGNRLWKWDYKNEKKYGTLPGNCIAGIAGCTIIGIIPLMIYISSQGGSEGTQMTNAGKELLADYFSKFEAALPQAGTVVK
jgi:hypothetical protein